MNNPMQLKAMIRNLAKSRNIPAQSVLHTFMIERLIERICLSSFRENLVIKGGFLIAAVIGSDSRATLDLDATLQAKPLTTDGLMHMFEEILSIECADDIVFEVKNITEIRESSAYRGYRVSFESSFMTMKVPLKMDITTGDVITPSAILFRYPLMFEDRSLPIMAYNTETILAEKIETVLRRGDQNTRARDLYDIYMLWNLRRDSLDVGELGKAVLATVESRGTAVVLQQADETLALLKTSSALRDLWNSYSRRYVYAKDISYEDISECLVDVSSVVRARGCVIQWPHLISEGVADVSDHR